MASFFLFSFAVFASFRFSCVVRRSLPCPSDLGARCRQVCLRKKRSPSAAAAFVDSSVVFCCRLDCFALLVPGGKRCRARSARSVGFFFCWAVAAAPCVCCTTTPASSAACVLSSRCRLQSAVCYQTSSLASSASSFPVRCTVARS